jgi:CRP-like cAMP-binding protein
VLVRSGEPATEIFLVLRGSLSVFAPDDEPGCKRLTTLSAGMTFGELAYVDRGPRSANVCADSSVECRTLPFSTLDALAETDPALHAKLLRNLIRVVVCRLRLANAEAAQLAR